MAGEYAYVMKDLRKVVPPKREILRGIWLSFFHGAKIGVLGANGAGKSTLLRIMAGVDKEHLGEAKPADGVKVGFLPQEPRLEAYAALQDKIEAANGWEIDRVIERAMDALRLPPPEAVVDNLSGGERRRVALCR